MTTAQGEVRCKFCFRKKPLGWGEPSHNDGCPDVLHLDRGNSVEVEVALTKKAMQEWKTGAAYGFDDNYIEPWRYTNYSKAFIWGYQAGKAEIDQLVEEAAEARNTDGEFQ